jgi:hypothetical protein
VENENLAMNSGVGASVAENGVPLTSTVRIRGGDFKVATVGAAVKALIPYRSGALAKLFAATTTAVYDISAFDDDTVPSAAISSLTNGNWVSVQISTAGGQYVVMANGADAVRAYNGSAWSSPAITGVTPADLDFVWLHGNRLWFIEAGTMVAWYLDVESIAGAAEDFNLGAVFENGGSLYIGGTWSSDSGSGFGERNVFISTEGEVAVYQGLNPGADPLTDPDAYRLVGRYNIGKPVGRQVMKAGGDLLIATTDGIVPLSAVVTKDPAALSMAAVSYNIEGPWKRTIKTITSVASQPVQMLKWQRESLGIIGFRHKAEVYVVNLQTGAWAKWTAKDVQALVIHNDLAYYGDSDGSVFQLDAGGSDNGAPYIFRWSFLPDHLETPGRLKTVHSARATFRALAPFEASLDVATDYRREFDVPPNAVIDDEVPALWDVGLWDVSLWDSAADSDARQTVLTYWRTINRSGVVAAPQVQITSGSDRKPDAELVTVDVIYDVGGTVV